MSLIIFRPAGIDTDQDILKPICDKCPGGMGMMFRNNNKMSIYTGPTDLDYSLALFEQTKDYDTAFYFRSVAYNEKPDKEDAQPYLILNEKDHGKDVFAMQTGYMYNLKKKQENRDDVFNFIVYYLKPFLINSPWAIYDENFYKMLKLITGESGKIIFLDKEKFIIPDKEKWFQHKGMLLSNEYTHSSTTYTSYPGAMYDGEGYCC